MSETSLLPHEQLRCNMRLSRSNLTYLELIREKERVDTNNEALSKIIEVARPFFSRRSSIQKVTLNKKCADELAAQSTQAA